MKKTFSLILVLAIVFSIPVISSAAPSPGNPVPPPPVEKIIEETQTTYRLIIHYIYPDGTPVFPDYTEQIDAGTPYRVPSPNKPNYTPSRPVVSAVMPPRDVTETVIYIPLPAANPDDPDDPDVPVPVFFSISDYDTPLGLGASIMNLGICIE